MPKAPEYTRKEQKQRNKQWAKEAYERGAVQEFPGAPIWNDWLKEQHEAKKSQVGLPRRIGRAALEIAAVSVLAARELPIAVTDHRQRRNAQIAERQRKIVERSKSAKAIPNTDLRIVNNSKLRKAAVGANSAKNRYDERLLESSSSAAERLSAKNDGRSQRKLGRLATWASDKLGKIDKKRMDTHMRRQEKFEAEKDVAWGKYLKENPEVEKRLIAEQKQRDKQYEVDSRKERWSQMQRNASFATQYFKERSIYSFSKALPRGLEPAAYDELAKSSVEYAAKNRQEDGKITLFSPRTLGSLVQDKMPLSADGAPLDGPRIFDGENRNTNFDFYQSDRALGQEVLDRQDYTGGVATSLWKMGFVNFESEKDIPYGKGEFNPDIEWSRGEDGTTFASIAYNPENELHCIIGGEHADPTSARIQLAINDTQRYAPEVNVGLVEQPALAHA